VDHGRDRLTGGLEVEAIIERRERRSQALIDEIEARSVVTPIAPLPQHCEDVVTMKVQVRVVRSVRTTLAKPAQNWVVEDSEVANDLGHPRHARVFGM